MARHRLPSLLIALTVAVLAAHAEAGEAAPASGESVLRLAPVPRPTADSALADRDTGWLAHVHVRKGAGFEVRRALEVGDRRVTLGLKGPVMKRKRLGLTFELRF